MSQTLKLKIENEKICFDRLDSFCMNAIVIQGVICAKFMIVNAEVRKINHCKKRENYFHYCKVQYRFPSLFAGVTYQQYSANNNAADNEWPLFYYFKRLLSLKSITSEDNRGN